MTPAYIPDLPRRWGVALSALFARDGYAKHREKSALVWREQSTKDRPGLLALDAPEDAVYQAADAAAREVFSYCDRYLMRGLVIDGIFLLCLRLGVPRPVGDTEAEIIARATDRGWWVRNIRKAHARRFEHAAIQLGFTHYAADPYISRESANRQARRNKQNAQLLAKTEVENEHGQRFTLAELAELGIANKAIRRGELMTRIRGFEEIAGDLRHVGMFWTITAPSKYHAVLKGSGESNPKYLAFGSPTPRDAQAYLVDVWACIRSALHRRGIHPYGFRIAEPHHDACPHWHMLLFVAPEHQAEMEKVVREYALLEDGDEAGAQKNRCKLVRIEAGKGTAAGYIAKYVAKNIDGANVGTHQTLEGHAVSTDLFDGEELTPSQRVCYWAQTWGIRQFQQIGGAPVGVWRELRRIKAETVVNAPEPIKAAWRAVQKIEGSDEVKKQADWAAYLRAQGGATVGRHGAIQLATRSTEVTGRYANYACERPCGVSYAFVPGAVYESVRYQWARVNDKGVGVAVGVPRTGVNNCTDPDPEEVGLKMWLATRALADEAKKQKIRSATWVDWPGIRKRAREIQKASDKFAYRGNHV